MSGWTPACPHPDDILRLATGEVSVASAPALIAHVRSCPFCIRQYADTRGLVGVAVVASPTDATQEMQAEGGHTSAVGGEAGTRIGPSDGRARPLWHRLGGPAWGFALGAAAAGLAVGLVGLRSARVERDRLAAELGEARHAYARQSAESQHLVQEVRRLRARRPDRPVQVASAADTAAVETAVLSGRMPISPGIASLASTVRGTAEPAAGGIRLLRPVTTYVSGDRPVLTVGAAPGVTNLRAVVTDASGVEVPVARRSGPAWQVQAPLRAGALCQWSAEGQLRGQRVLSPVATFAVLDARSAAEISAARKRYTGQPLVLAVLLSRAGLLDESEDALARVLKAHPRHPVAAALLGDLKRARAGGP